MAWLQRRTHAIKESWERILLEELFVFSGGSEGTWLTVAGWIPSKDTRQRTNDRAGVLLEDGRVVGLHLGCNGLLGVLSPSCGLLSKLRVVDLSGNMLKGLPVAGLQLEGPSLWHNTRGTLDPIYALRGVEVINLSSNIFSGSISDSIGSLISLKQLFLSDNKLTGCIPGSLSLLRKLAVVCLDGNMLSGVLPPCVASLPKLAVLALQGNRLSGPVPDLKDLTSLRSLELSCNRFEGSPPSLKMLPALRVFACHCPGHGRGGLSGGLQNVFNAKISGRAMQLVRLDLSGHVLGGNIPVGLRGLHCLEILILCDNKLRGWLPQWLGDLGNLRHVDLSANLLKGPVPTSLVELPHLEVLLLQDNALDGELSPKLAAVLHSGGIRFTFDGNDSSTNSRRPTVVEAYIPPSRVSGSIQPGEPLAEKQGRAGGRGQLRSVVVEENCVEGAAPKESKPGQQSIRGQSCTKTLLPSGRSLEATEPPPREKERDPPQRGRRGTEML